VPGEDEMAVVAKGDALVVFIACVEVVCVVCGGPFAGGFGEMFRGTAVEATADAVENCAEAVIADGEIAPVVVLDLA